MVLEGQGQTHACMHVRMGSSSLHSQEADNVAMVNGMVRFISEQTRWLANGV